MAKKYFQQMKKADFKALGKKFNIDPVIARLLVNRDIKEEDMYSFLNPKEDDIISPYILQDGEKAAKKIKDFILNKKKIRIIGDYDVDGIMSTYIFVSSLKNLGADVDFDIPNRVKDGYGLNERLVEKARHDKVDLIITCDNGIAAFSAIELATRYGIYTIVTDHHIVPYDIIDGQVVERLVKADYVINPHRKDDKSPFKDICGAYVAYKMCILIYDAMKISTSYVRTKLKYAAIATICDVMPLIDENRVIVRIGLRELSYIKNLKDLSYETLEKNNLKYITDDDYPIKEVLCAAGIKNEEVLSDTIGFIIGPLFNATGRLDDASIAVNLLLSRDTNKIVSLSQKLFRLNNERKNKTLKALSDAKIQMDKYMDDDILVLYLKNLHESIAGIAAGRIKEISNKPTFVLVEGENCAKGSGRSIENYPMYEELNKCSDLLLKYGGHKMAAGLSLKEENIDAFRKRLNDNSILKPDDFIEKVNIDLKMPLSYISKKLIKELSILEPCGEKNNKPLFADKDIRMLKVREIGKNKNVLRFDLLDEKRNVIKGIMFSNTAEAKEKLFNRYGKSIIEESEYRNLDSNVKITFTYYPTLNYYKNMESIQVVIDDII